MSWIDGGLCAFDCEATSVNPEEARIVAVVVAVVGADREPDTLSLLVNPGIPIPPESTEVHGITDEAVQATGTRPEEALTSVSSALMTAIDESMPICGMNLAYDCTLLDRECRRHGVVPPDWSRMLAVDVMVLDRHLDPWRRGSRKLADLCEHYRATLGEAHDAQNDAVAAARLVWRIIHSGQVHRNPRDARERAEANGLAQEWDRVRCDLPALHAAQVGWRREQAESLERYFRRGNPAKSLPPDPSVVIERDWPLIPLSAAVDG